MKQTLTIPAIGPTLNEWYAGQSWHKRKRTKDAWRLLVRDAVRRHQTRPVERYPVRLVVRLHFGPGKRRTDWDNGAATAKLVQDGLVKAGVLKGDSPRYVEGGTIEPLRTKEASYTEIIITETEE